MNTNKIFKWAAGALCLTAAVGTTSCADSFLDREPDGYYATKDQIAEAAKWNEIAGKRTAAKPMRVCMNCGEPWRRTAIATTQICPMPSGRCACAPKAF